MSKIQLVAQANLPTEYGIFKMVGFEFPDTKKEHVALVMGIFQTKMSLCSPVFILNA